MEEFGQKALACVMVVGLEVVQDLVMMLTSVNQVREEFGMWIDDKIHKQLMQVAADLESCATTRNLAIATAELIDFL
ncbi:MAG: hypothetical protein V7K21_03670 [Nostoc sp.]|uniref:hypothetical protein n=1 Tax=Nostoc sp. TaxID=1180 RepID=UPI002FF6F951